MSEKMLNRIISGVRIEVEHVIAGVKRCRIVKEVLRLRKAGVSDVVMESPAACTTCVSLVVTRCLPSIYGTGLAPLKADKV